MKDVVEARIATILRYALMVDVGLVTVALSAPIFESDSVVAFEVNATGR